MRTALNAKRGEEIDIFEGQIFVASMNEAMPELVPAGTEAQRRRQGELPGALVIRT